MSSRPHHYNAYITLVTRHRPSCDLSNLPPYTSQPSQYCKVTYHLINTLQILLLRCPVQCMNITHTMLHIYRYSASIMSISSCHHCNPTILWFHWYSVIMPFLFTFFSYFILLGFIIFYLLFYVSLYCIEHITIHSFHYFLQ